MVTGLVGKGSTDRGPRRNGLAIFFIALHDAIGQPQCKRGVGIAGGPLDGDGGFHNAGVGLPFLLVQFVADLTDSSVFWLQCLDQLDERILRLGDGHSTGLGDLTTRFGIQQGRPLDQFRRPLSGTLAAQRGLHDRIVAAALFRQKRQIVGQEFCLQIRMDGSGRKQFLLK